MASPENEQSADSALLESDAAAGFEITHEFMRVSQMDDMFTRSFWNPLVKSDDTDASLTASG